MYLTNPNETATVAVRDRPVFVVVSDEMERAGLAELADLVLEADAGYLVRSLYMAMEYQRLASLGVLGPVTDDAIEVLKGQFGDSQRAVV